MDHRPPATDRPGALARRLATRRLATCRLLAPFLAALAVLALFAPVAIAADPPRISGPITDQTRTLSTADKARITAASDALERDTKVQLFTLFVDSTSPLDMAEFANQTAIKNGLGAKDALLAVALGDRTYYLWVNDSVPLDNAQIDALLVDRLEPGLQAGDYAGAVAAVADGMRGELAGAGVTAAPATSVPGTVTPAPSSAASGSTSGKGPNPLTLIAIVVVVALIAGIWLMLTRKRNAELGALRSGLSSQANSLLVSADDVIRDMEQDVAFAQAEFGDEAAAPFAEAVLQAKAEMAEAFKVRQQLDDEVPENEATRERMHREIIGRCSKAQALVEAQRANIESLRELEKKAPEILDGLPAQEDQLEARVGAATQAYERLGATYAESLRQPVAGNLEEAQKRLDIVRLAVDKGKAAFAEGDARTGTQLAVASQVALQQAGDLLGAIERTAAAADDASARVAGVLAETEADLATAKAGVGSVGGPAQLTARIGEVEALVAAARAAAAQPKPDPIAAYKQAVQAAGASDEILAGIRSEAERIAREKATLQQTLGAAELEYRRAADFIAARRSGVDREARTRLSEAERHLAAAQVLATQDIARAAEEARLADSLAEQAMQLASADFDHYDRGGPGAPPSRGGGGGVDVAGILIGAAIGGMLSGGGGGGGMPSSGGHGRGGRW
jgi:uncharacterized membrane protein YgcG